MGGCDVAAIGELNVEAMGGWFFILARGVRQNVVACCATVEDGMDKSVARLRETSG